MINSQTLTLKIDALDAVRQIEGISEALTDILSHSGDFRAALEIARDSAKPKGIDHDDPSYWQHQINVLDRIVKALTKPAEDPAQQSLFES